MSENPKQVNRDDAKSESTISENASENVSENRVFEKEMEKRTFIQENSPEVEEVEEYDETSDLQARIWN